MSLGFESVRDALERLAQQCTYIRAAIDQVGYPPERVGSNDPESLMRIIVGQQLSTKAAATINARLTSLLDGGGYAVIPQLSDEALRGVGLSRPKIRYLRALAEAILSQSLDLEVLSQLSDEDVVQRLIAMPGFGPWSANMYLIFNLQRPDVWPVGDLAVRAGVSRLVGASCRLSERELEQWGARWRPERSSVALLAWYFYAKVPGI